jgi:hypothetical protein
MKCCPQTQNYQFLICPECVERIQITFIYHVSIIRYIWINIVRQRQLKRGTGGTGEKPGIRNRQMWLGVEAGYICKIIYFIKLVQGAKQYSKQNL